jgi:hypothetical protein
MCPPVKRQRRGQSLLQARCIDDRRVLKVGAPEEVDWTLQLQRDWHQPLGPTAHLGRTQEALCGAVPAEGRVAARLDVWQCLAASE